MNKEMIIGFVLGVFVMLMISMMARPYSNYAKSFEILNNGGIVTVSGDVLNYQCDTEMSRREWWALAKLSQEYDVNLEVVVLGGLDFSN